MVGTVVEEVQCPPSSVFDRNRVKIFVTPSWIGGITSSRRVEFPSEWLMFRETKTRAILEPIEGTHIAQCITPQSQKFVVDLAENDGRKWVLNTCP